MSVPLQPILNKNRYLRKFSYMEEFKTTLYIQLLSKGEATEEQFQEALSDFTQRVYDFCKKEKDMRFIYFSLNYIRTLLIHIEEIRVPAGSKLSVGGGMAFVDAAIEWIKNAGISIPQGSEEAEEDATTPVVWTGKVIHLVEFIYGSATLKNFNDGKASIKEVSAHFSKMLGIEIKDPSGCYVNMRERVQESCTTYIDSMRDALLERMEKDDEKLYRRKK